jgi:hypothetical protein
MSVLSELSEKYEFSLLSQSELIRVTQKAPPFPGLPWEPPEGWWCHVAGTIDALEYVDDLAGCIVWNSVQPPTRALCRAVQARGKPAFEIDHGCFATYLHGHFESDPAADNIFCSREQAEFLLSNGYKGDCHITGRPMYDDWVAEDRIEVRKRLGLPPFQPLVLRTTTWTHSMSRWSDSDILIRETEEAFLKAFMAVQKVFPLSLAYSIRPNLGMDPEQVSRDMKNLGVDDGFVTKDVDLKDLIQAADVVVSPKSSAAAEAVLLDKPAIVVDFRPQLDVWAWKNRGILPCRTSAELPHLILKCLADEETQDRLAKERPEAKLWFNGPGQAAERIAQEVDRICQC